MSYSFIFPSCVGMNSAEFLKELDDLSRRKGVKLSPEVTALVAELVERNGQRAARIVQQSFSANLEGLAKRISALESKK